MTISSRYPNAPMEADVTVKDPRWRRWFQDVWNLTNAIGLPQPTAITVGASPFTYQFIGAGTASILLSGGTVTLVEFSRNAVTFYPTGTGPGMYTVSQNDRLRITYAVLPTATLVLR